MREALDIAYVLMVEEATRGKTTSYEARGLVDNILLDPETRAMRDDQAAMQILAGANRMPRAGRR